VRVSGETAISSGHQPAGGANDGGGLSPAAASAVARVAPLASPRSATAFVASRSASAAHCRSPSGVRRAS